MPNYSHIYLPPEAAIHITVYILLPLYIILYIPKKNLSLARQKNAQRVVFFIFYSQGREDGSREVLVCIRTLPSILEINRFQEYGIWIGYVRSE